MRYGRGRAVSDGRDGDRGTGMKAEEWFFMGMSFPVSVYIHGGTTG